MKLADFGTADLVEETLGQPVGLDQFTTLENTPVDFLVDGDRATQVRARVYVGHDVSCLPLSPVAERALTVFAYPVMCLSVCLSVCPFPSQQQQQQGYAADAFSLGLAVLHLFTGSAPYEEVRVVSPFFFPRQHQQAASTASPEGGKTDVALTITHPPTHPPVSTTNHPR